MITDIQGEVSMNLLHEQLARARSREVGDEIREHNEARRIRSIRRWRRLAHWAAKRAEKARAR